MVYVGNYESMTPMMQKGNDPASQGQIRAFWTFLESHNQIKCPAPYMPLATDQNEVPGFWRNGPSVEQPYD